MKKQKNYSIENRGEISVLVTLNLGNSHNYPFSPIYEYMEVDCDIDRDNLTLKKYNGNLEYSYRRMMNKKDNLANWQSREHAVQALGEKVVLEAEKAVKKNARELFDTVKSGRENPVWLALKPIVDSTVVHFNTDFYFHDCLMLQTTKPSKFVWLVRNTGTWLIYHKTEFFDAILDQERKEKRNNIYFWNGHLLSEIDFDTAMKQYSKLQ